ncbi:uncharacterized protein MKK02DRAFT_39176 [Dioszegia hungarica]|uniref:Uncharacterized protein n=1 Tax=Dioszegia hungarica TaxID=4972 RepID=A0AA38H1Y4_9TREE|nr:uncharacterized protein MKK02DRAFT_39176 [Dioszegia hungarica]KAI9633197.1 hypothetical protein MKK02DRAFT_39176 [Dioszegia hungarica]
MSTPVAPQQAGLSTSPSDPQVEGSAVEEVPPGFIVDKAVFGDLPISYHPLFKLFRCESCKKTTLNMRGHYRPTGTRVYKHRGIPSTLISSTLAKYPEEDPQRFIPHPFPLDYRYPHHIHGIQTAVAGYRCHLCSYTAASENNMRGHFFRKHFVAKPKTGGHYSACGDIQSFGNLARTGPRWFPSSPPSLAVPAESSSARKRARPESAAIEQSPPKRSRRLALSSQPEPGSVPAGDSSGANFATPVRAQSSSIPSSSSARLPSLSAQAKIIAGRSARITHALSGAIPSNAGGPSNRIIPPTPSHSLIPSRLGTSIDPSRIAPAHALNSSLPGETSGTAQVAVDQVRHSIKAPTEAHQPQRAGSGANPSRTEQEIRDELRAALARTQDHKAELKRIEQQQREKAQATRDKAQAEKEKAAREVEEAEKEAKARVESARETAKEKLEKAEEEARAEAEAARRQAEDKMRRLREAADEEVKKAERDALESVQRAKCASGKAQAEAEAAKALAEGVKLEEEEEEEIIFVGNRQRGEGSGKQPFSVLGDGDDSEVEEEVEV